MFLFSLWCFECFWFRNGNSEAFFWFIKASRAYLSEISGFWYLTELIAKLFWAIVIVLGQVRLLLTTYGFAVWIVNLWGEITSYGHQTVFIKFIWWKHWLIVNVSVTQGFHLTVSWFTLMHSVLYAKLIHTHSVEKNSSCNI